MKNYKYIVLKNLVKTYKYKTSHNSANDIFQEEIFILYQSRVSKNTSITIMVSLIIEG